MFRLASIIYAMAGITLAGIMIVAALTAGYDTLNYILIAAGTGAVAGFPASYFVAKAIKDME